MSRRRFRIVWTDPAVRDLENIIEYIATEGSVPAAATLWQRLETRISTLSEHPNRGRIVPELRAQGLDGYREIIYRPYRVMYRLFRQDVVLLAVVDGRRDLQQLLLDRALSSNGDG